MNMFARFDENPAMTLRVIKETKRYGRTHGRTDGRTDNVKTVYPLQTKFAGGIIILSEEYSKCSKYFEHFFFCSQIKWLFSTAEIHKMLVRIANKENPDQTGVKGLNFQTLIGYKKGLGLFSRQLVFTWWPTFDSS